MAGLVRRVFLGQFPPLRPGAQHPQNPIEHCLRVLPWATASIGTPLGPQNRFNQHPLGIAEFPSSSHALLVTGFQPPANREVGSTTIVESRTSAGADGKRRPVSRLLSSNRTCPLRASGFPMDFTARLTQFAAAGQAEGL